MGNRWRVSGALPVVAVCVWLSAAWHPLAQAPDAPLPPTLERYLADVVNPSRTERSRLLAGEALTRVLDSATNQQVTVFGAIWIDATMPEYVAAVRNIETFERGRGFRVTRRISSPPGIGDFADLRLPESDVAALRACEVGDCKLKLSEADIRAFRTEVDWNAPDSHASAEVMMRRVAFDHTRAYLAGGNEQLAVYRDKSEPLSLSAEFKVLLDEMPQVPSFSPEVRRYMLDYPRARLSGATSFLYWQETEFGLKRTIRVSHLTIRESPADVMVMSKMIYSNHYFRSALELRWLLPDPVRGGFWFLTISTSRTDGLSGFIGLFVRPRVRSGARDGTETVLVNTKRRLEGTP